MILDILKRSESNNLRILKQALDDFKYIYDQCHSHFAEINRELLLRFLLSTLAISFEFKLNRIDAKAFESIVSCHDFSRSLQEEYFMERLIEGEQKPNSPLRQFKDRYFPAYQYGEPIFFKFIERYISTGIFDTEIFIDEVISLTSKEDLPPENKLLRYGYWSFSDEEFNTIIDEVYTRIKAGRVSLPLYYNLFILYKSMIDWGLVNKKLDELKTDFKNGIKISAGQAENPFDLSTTFTVNQVNNADIQEIKQDVHCKIKCNKINIQKPR